MPVMFTARSADKLKPGEKQRDVWDAAVPGLGLRLSPAGTKTWTLKYRVGRHQRRMTIGSFKIHVARRSAQEGEGRAEGGRRRR
jgi:hypothetical protein